MTENTESPTLVVFDGLQSLPAENSFLYKVMSRSSTHIVVLLNGNSPVSSLKKAADKKLMRGTNVIELGPLSELDSTQRLVHGIMSQIDFVPYNHEQKLLADIAEKTVGSPDLVEVTSALISEYISDHNDGDLEGESESGFLERFHSDVCCYNDDDDSGDFAGRLVRGFSLSECDLFFLSTLSLFGTAPIPRRLVETIQLFSLTASSEFPSGRGPLAHLVSSHLLNVYPSTVIHSPAHPLSSHAHDDSHDMTESDFYYMPQVISDAVRRSMDRKDLAFSSATAFRALNQLHKECSGKGAHGSLCSFMAGLAKILADSLENCNGMEECYKEVYRTYLLYAIC